MGGEFIYTYEAIFSPTHNYFNFVFIQVTNVYIDTVGDPEYYKSRLIQALGSNFGNFVIEKKADATYKVVGAASIVAKVTRDTMVKNWQFKEGKSVAHVSREFGSGYPADETTVKW